MAYAIKKALDGDISLGNLRAELVNLNPAVSDYAAGGYLVQGIGGSTENTGNVGMRKVLGVIPVGGQGGYTPVFNPVTSKVQIFQTGAVTSPEGEVAPGTDLSAISFLLILVGI